MDITTQAETVLTETAYIEVFNQMAASRPTVSNSVTAGILKGIRKMTGSVWDSNKMKVQFNPESLSFQCGEKTEQARQIASVDATEDGVVNQTDISQKEQPLSVSMSLIFDRTRLASGSVQEEVEGFLAVMQNPNLRLVKFYWGMQYYAGILDRVGARYLLFNSLGIPVRAQVDLTIRLT